MHIKNSYKLPLTVLIFNCLRSLNQEGVYISARQFIYKLFIELKSIPIFCFFSLGLHKAWNRKFISIVTSFKNQFNKGNHIDHMLFNVYFKADIKNYTESLKSYIYAVRCCSLSSISLG